MGDPTRWAELYAARREAASRWPDVFRLPVRRTPGRVVAAACRSGAAVLDVGAGERRLEQTLAQRAPGVVYRSMDIDRATTQDYHDLGDVPEPVDLVALLEVIEHLPLEAGLELLRSVRRCLKPGGVLVVSTPAIHTPGRFLRDATHVTPYAHDELAGACALTGYSVEEVVRTWNGSALARFVRLWLAAPFHRYFGVDFAHSVCVVARNTAP